MKTNKQYLEKALAINIPIINKTKTLTPDDKSYKKGDVVVFDFGDHYVGYLDIKIGYKGNHPDAPLYMKISFAEHKRELDQDANTYKGWISSSWIQQEYVHVDTIPGILSLPRRYAFRYVKIEILDTSSNYEVTFNKLSINSISSANYANVKTLKNCDIDDKNIDKIALRTLHNCMQNVFEDGPKRDRRLWLGDLRLEALTNYVSFKNYDLVKKCLYLFASSTLDDGNVSSNVFISPKIEGDFQTNFDYSLLFIVVLWEYFENTNNYKVLNDLYPVALKQYKLAKESFENDILVTKDTLGWCFIDWSLDLDKQVSATGVYLYASKYLIKIAKELHKNYTYIENDIALKTKKALELYYDNEKDLFVSNGQLSLASQIWMILGDGVSDEMAERILNNIFKYKKVIMPQTPYMMHYYLEALIKINKYDKAHEVMTSYWGKMIEDGADTFYELFNIENPNYSPYGSPIINSYCHAWSCTPSYFIRKYFSK